jgi:RNA polymerase sigma factor for flagellar operon FliA
MAATSTPEEKNRLVLECQGLVRHLAQQVRTRLPSWVEMDDLISYGQVGLLEAAADFDASRGVKFSTFAFYRIRGAIFDGVNKLTWFRAARDPGTKFSQLSDSLIESTMEESASKEPNSGDNLVREASWFSQIASSLAIVCLATDDDGRPVDVEDTSAPVPWSGLVETETGQQLQAAMEQLPPDAAALIRAVYFEDRTLQEAASRLGISKSWASRMHARALEQMARNMNRAEPEKSSD